MIMGCYGLGIGRTVAAAIEQNHDEAGIIWPRPLAPFDVLLVALNPQDEQVMETASRLYDSLTQKGIDLLFDDRKERPGVKFNDADLIGVPLRLTVGHRALKDNEIEAKLRQENEKSQVPLPDAVQKAGELIQKLYDEIDDGLVEVDFKA